MFPRRLAFKSPRKLISEAVEKAKVLEREAVRKRPSEARVYFVDPLGCKPRASSMAVSSRFVSNSVAEEA